MKKLYDYKKGDIIYYLIDNIYVKEAKVTSVKDESYHGVAFWVLYAKDKDGGKKEIEIIHDDEIYPDYLSAVKVIIKNLKQNKKKLKEQKSKIKVELVEIDTKLSTLKNYVRNNEGEVEFKQQLDIVLENDM